MDRGTIAGMSVLSLLFSRSGVLAPKPFGIAVTLLYVANFLSQMLLSGDVTAQAGLWPFAIVQAVLIWNWIVLHVKRLRDAAKSSGLAIGIACLYMLTIVLVLLVMVMIVATDASTETARTGQGLIRLFLVLYLFAMLVGSPEFGVMTFWLMGFMALLLMPLMVAFGFSIWTGTRPRIPEVP